MNHLTEYVLSEQGTDHINFLIKRKMDSEPFLCNKNIVKNIVTDIDHQPYTRYFRGVYHSSEPKIFEREAGWRPRNDDCYNINYIIEDEQDIGHCFETACSTKFPCFTKFQAKYNDKNKLDEIIHSNCSVEYR